MKKSVIRQTSALLVCWVLATAFLFAQPAKERLQEIPPVFVIGEFEQEYETLVGDYSLSLLDACGGDMNQAFELWIGLVEEMEAYSKQANFELNGIQAWFHVFFEKDGSISRIGFHLKPTSRNVDTHVLIEFLAQFIAQYKFPYTARDHYSNYTSVSFPSMYNRPMAGDHTGGK